MKRSKFSLSNSKLLSCDMGELVPINLMEVLAGDSIQQATSCLIRCSPLLAPVMHKVDVRIHHWYVPHRLVWESWEDFITGGSDGMDASVFPTITIGGGSGAAVGSLADYLGIPTGVNNIEVSALPFRAYAMVYNESYRDQDLVTPVAISDADGPDATTNTTLLQCAWEKDYFTSARPWEQKGPNITIPIGSTAPVEVTEAMRTNGSGSPAGPFNLVRGATPTGGQVAVGYADAGQTGAVGNELSFIGTADLSGASAVTINRLREALALQRYAEARARYGSRYVEYLRYLGVKSSDARLQRPEYLGGGKTTVQFSEVLQTAEGTNPVGEMRGHGISAMRTNRYRRFFEEHGYVISLLSVRPKTIYTQGLSRTWNRRFKEDFWQRELQHIGQQEVLNKELYAAHTDPNDTFGWQDRYDEYRRAESTVSGEFRESVLDYWHLAREFSGNPALNASFVTCVPSDRIFAAQENDTLYVMANHSIQARRLVAKTGTSYIF